MLTPIEHLLNVPILSLQTGAELARTSDVIVNPMQMVIAAFRVSGSGLDAPDTVLHPEDIREISGIGIIIDSSDQLMSTEGLVRLQQVIDFNFILPNIKVEDELGHKVGVVKSYAVEPEGFYIQQLYVKPPLLQSLNVTSLTIHRSQIISVTNEKIVVKGATVKDTTVKIKDAVQSTFANPFRAPAQPENKEITQ